MRKIVALLLALAACTAHAQVHQRMYGEATTVQFKLYNADGTLDVDEADGGTEVTLYCNDGSGVTATNDFVDEGSYYSIALTAAEMQCARLAIDIGATDREVVFVETYGHPLAAIPHLGREVADYGTAQASTSTTLVLAAPTNYVDDTLNDRVVCLQGTGAGQCNLIVDYVGSTDTATVAEPWITTPTTGSYYTIFSTDQGFVEVDENGAVSANVVDIESQDPTDLIDGRIAAAALATQASVDVIDQNVDDVESNVTTILADTNDIQTRLPAALVSGRMDSSVGAMAANVVTATAIAADAIGASELATDAITSAEVAASAVTEIQTGLSTLTTAQVNAEVDTALADYDGPTKAELDAGLADLNDLSSAEVGALVQAELEEIHLDHLLAADYDPASKPGVGTALLNELVEIDAGVSRFTANALEQGPAGGGGGGGNVTQIEGTDATDYLDALVAPLATQTSVDTIDNIVDQILVDTGTTLDDFVDDLETRLTAARAGYLDNLNVGGAVSTQASVDAVPTAAENAAAMLTQQRILVGTCDNGTTTSCVDDALTHANEALLDDRLICFEDGWCGLVTGFTPASDTVLTTKIAPTTRSGLAYTIFPATAQ